MNWRALVSGGVLMTLCWVAPAGATPISGQLNFTGAAQVSATTIDWIPLGTGEGDLFTTFPGTDYFSQIFLPVSGVNDADSIDLTAGTVLPLANFLNDFDTPFARYNDLSFTLTEVVIPAGQPVCNGSEGVGDTCVAFPGSPFLLTRTTTGTGVEFDVRGFFLDPTEGADSGANNAIGIYTANLSGLTPNAIRLIIIGGGSVGSSYSAQFTATPIPEPLSLTLLGTGLLGLGFRARRRGWGKR